MGKVPQKHPWGRCWKEGWVGFSRALQDVGRGSKAADVPTWKKQLLACPESDTPHQEAPLPLTPGCEPPGAPSKGMFMTFAKLNAITKSYVLSRPQGHLRVCNNPDMCLDRRHPAKLGQLCLSPEEGSGSPFANRPNSFFIMNFPVFYLPSD